MESSTGFVRRMSDARRMAENSELLTTLEPIEPIMSEIETHPSRRMSEIETLAVDAESGVEEGAPPKLGEGCYLTFDRTSDGTLFLNWSLGSVEGAIGYYHPEKPVPKFKLKQSGGRQELMRGMMGGGGRSKGGGGAKVRYLEGWCAFMKQAYKGTEFLQLQPGSDALACDLYYIGDNKVHSIAVGVPVDLRGAQAIAALARHADAFKGVVSMGVPLFIASANKSGFGLALC